MVLRAAHEEGLAVVPRLAAADVPVSLAGHISAGIFADLGGLETIVGSGMAEELDNYSPFSSLVDSTGRDVIELPPAPSSLSLFMSAMITLGSWQLVRSAKDLSLGHLPEWYHSGGPVQVGHATPFDLDYNSLVLVTFDEPIVLTTLCLDARRELRSRCTDQHFLILADPRGPPIDRS